MTKQFMEDQSTLPQPKLSINRYESISSEQSPRGSTV